MLGPKGLGIDGKLLFICDTPNGLKIFDRLDPLEIELLYHFEHLNPVDVIPFQGLLLVMTESSIHQFSYQDHENIFEISTFELQ